jgi:hypothetical protein
MINADNFKMDTNKLTEFRIRLVVQYIVYCYLQILTDDKKYFYSERGKIPQEEYLRNGLVDDYLQKSKNKAYFKQNIAENPSVEITFHSEETMTYIDFENQKRMDKIDIAIWENELQSLWTSRTDNEIKFAVECKRIETLADTDKYISDIQNFCNRNYIKTRLPFEGQLAFIEKATITHIQLKDNINKKLENKTSIITENPLNEIVVNNKYDGTYLSKHQRNTNNQSFSIYHLLFDYSSVIIN